jgi:Na+-transporting NADH:ubiquinone oxidoreductase subunit C
MSGGAKQKLFTVFFMFAVTFVSMSIVTIVQMSTRSTVERNRTLFQKQAVCDAAGMPPPESSDALIAWYDANVRAIKTDAGEPDHFRVRSIESPDVQDLVVVTTGPGLWGQITAFVGFDAAGSRIKAVTFLDHVETPGLGARIDEPWFKRQFIGKRGPFNRLTPERKDKSMSSSPDAETFDQITGATITSTAVRNIMNESLARARSLGAATTDN